MYINRYLEGTVTNLSKSFKILYIAGPRQVGKTTMLSRLAEKEGMAYASMDDLSTRNIANEDPELFLQRYPPPVLIDEVQYTPGLFPYMKILSDASNKRGLFWMTGSQHFTMMKNVRESLAGRVAIIDMLGFSSAEEQGLEQAAEAFVPGLEYVDAEHQDINAVFRRIHRGCFPVMTHSDPPPHDVFYNSYIQTYIDRDLRDIFNISKIAEFNKFLRICAARTGQVLNYSNLANDSGVSVHAAREWINILVAGYQIFLLHPYHSNISKRMIKAPKMYFLDTGLAAFLTRWSTVETLMNGAMAGAFFETYVVGEIIRSYWHRGRPAPVYYFRDKEGHEIDLLIDTDSVLYPVEIKLGAKIDRHDVKHINYLRKIHKSTGRGAVISLASEKKPVDRDNDNVPVHLIR